MMINKYSSAWPVVIYRIPVVPEKEEPDSSEACDGCNVYIATDSDETGLGSKHFSLAMPADDMAPWYRYCSCMQGT